MSGYTEDHLVEQPAIQLMQHELGWDVMNCFGEWALLRQGYEGQAKDTKAQRRILNRISEFCRINRIC